MGVTPRHAVEEGRELGVAHARHALGRRPPRPVAVRVDVVAGPDDVVDDAGHGGACGSVVSPGYGRKCVVHLRLVLSQVKAPSEMEPRQIRVCKDTASR